MALLAHLYSHIRGSQEDIATLSLQYLLMQSKDLNRAFTHRVSSIMHIQLDDEMQYMCQVVRSGEKKDRPDMSATNSQGIESVLFEVKFYAALTENQPLTYLDRIRDNKGKGLVFICPLSRRTSLWSKLIDICNGRKIEKLDFNCVKVDDVVLSIMTWSEVIELLERVSSSSAIEYSSDVSQLKEYCKMIDNEAFIPFSEADLSAEMANKSERYYQIIDEVIDLLCADKTLRTSKDKLKSAPYRRGYSRSLYIDDFTITLNYDRYMWKNPKTTETPFWVAVRDASWEQNDSISKNLLLLPENKKDEWWNTVFVALEPLQNATFDDVCNDIKKQILSYLSVLTV